jgi:hypothetical protein
MLIFCLIMSLVMLLWVNALVGRSSPTPGQAILVAVCMAIVPTMSILFLPPVILQGVLTTFAIIAFMSGYLDKRGFQKVSFGAMGVAYLVIGFHSWNQLGEIQARYPLESMEARVPSVDHELETILPSVEVNLQRQDALQSTKPIFSTYARRTEALKRLHERSLEVFAELPGFGVGRMVGFSEWAFKPSTFQQVGSRQQAPLEEASLGEYALEAESTDFKSEKWLQMHQNTAINFASTDRNGYIRDRQAVAGFLAHQVEATPASIDPWKFQRVDLIGVLLGKAPRVYVSDQLPSMEKLHETPTRTLDEFEERGLQALREGEDLYQREFGDKLRVIGSLRNSKQCMDCHGKGRGQLLGAFSYVFKK